MSFAVSARYVYIRICFIMAYCNKTKLKRKLLRLIGNYNLNQSNVKKILFITFCSCLFAVSAIAQTKVKGTVNTPVNGFKKLLTGTGLPFKMVNDSVAVIPYEGDNIPSYEVAVQKVGGLYIVYTSLSEALPGKIDETKYRYLLERNHHFDMVKIGMDDEKAVYVRIDTYASNVTVSTLTRIIKQVANVTNIIGGDFK